MIDVFADALRKKLREDVGNYKNDIANRSCRTFDEYQYLCGVIQGLAFAERHLNDLQKLAESDDDE